MNTVLFISGHPDDHMTGAGFLNKLTGWEKKSINRKKILDCFL